ncbi:MAG: hypothetical protein HFG34_01785 [Eubacterium sp.]|nr:hypothetical protein [Eubacterium sp.]
MVQMTKKKKVLTFLSISITLIILIVVTLYVNLKIFTVKKVLMSNEQEVYIMGTFHTGHFERYANYSIEEMLNAINNIDPDVVFIEARENSFIEYGVVDGPIDMCVAYSYCSENNIPVEMIDYWEITNDFKTNTTTDERDDQIHRNIMEKLDAYENKKVLVICGFGHLNAQTERLIDDGGQKQHVSHIGNLFKEGNKNFVYPNMICDVWEERTLFYAHTVPQLVQADESLNEETKSNWMEDKNYEFYNWQMEYCKLFQENALYMPTK